jgi:hypothetical protein
MFSKRFNLPVVVTRHAALRMVERDISDSDLLDVIDTGESRYKDVAHLWAFKYFPGRDDNLLCAVLILETAVVVKTVMHHFELEP